MKNNPAIAVSLLVSHGTLLACLSSPVLKTKFPSANRSTFRDAKLGATLNGPAYHLYSQYLTDRFLAPTYYFFSVVVTGARPGEFGNPLECIC